MTDAVHAKGGVIFCQIWHTGRASPPSFRGGAQPVSSGTSSISGNALDGTKYSDNPPRPMTVDEIHETTREFGAAAKRALEAGFDGVEIHGENKRLVYYKAVLIRSQVPTVTFWINSCTTISTIEPTTTVGPSRTVHVSC